MGAELFRREALGIAAARGRVEDRSVEAFDRLDEAVRRLRIKEKSGDVRFKFY